jgi:hypothetical protein
MRERAVRSVRGEAIEVESNGDQKEGQVQDTHHRFVRVWKLINLTPGDGSRDVESWRGPLSFHTTKEGRTAPTEMPVRSFEI